MAILMVLEADGMTEEQYRAANAQLGIHGDADAPDGLISHYAGRTDTGIVAVDVWESEEKLNRFFEEGLGEALAANGAADAGPPMIVPVHNLITQGAGQEPGVLVLIDAPGFTDEQYDSMAAGMDAHVGDGSNHPAVSHTAARTNDGMFVADVWESPEAFGAFAESQIGPAAERVGLGPIEPRFVPVINRLRGRVS